MRRLLVTVLTAVCTVAATGAAAPGASAATGPHLTRFEAHLLSLINHARERHGLRPLSPAPGTVTVARHWSTRLAADKTLSHNPSLVHDLEQHGSRDWHHIAENVGVVSAGHARELFHDYMRSPYHRQNILDASVRYVGVGTLQQAGRAWNTLDFVDVYHAS